MVAEFGIVIPFSQFPTVLFDTLSFSATSSCVIPAFTLAAAKDIFSSFKFIPPFSFGYYMSPLSGCQPLKVNYFPFGVVFLPLLVYILFTTEANKMSESDFKKIFSNRLQHYLEINDMTQAELSKRLGVGTTSVSNWCLGIKTPRMDKVDAMCNIFGCRRRDLMEIPQDDSVSNYSLTPEEYALMEKYQKLNAVGRKKARDYITDLTEQDKYTKDAGSSASAAG